MHTINHLILAQPIFLLTSSSNATLLLLQERLRKELTNLKELHTFEKEEAILQEQEVSAALKKELATLKSVGNEPFVLTFITTFFNRFCSQRRKKGQLKKKNCWTAKLSWP